MSIQILERSQRPPKSGSRPPGAGEAHLLDCGSGQREGQSTIRPRAGEETGENVFRRHYI